MSFQNVVMVITFISTTSTELVISVVWTEFAMELQKTGLAGNARTRLSRYKYVVAGFLILFVPSTIALVALGNYALAAIVCVPAALVVSMSFVVGLVRISKVINYFAASSASAVSDEDNPAATAVLRLKAMLVSVRYTARRLAIYNLGMLAALAAYFFVGGVGADTPIAQPSEAATLLLYVFMAPMNTRVLRYLRASSPKVLAQVNRAGSPARFVSPRIISSYHSLGALAFSSSAAKRRRNRIDNQAATNVAVIDM